MRGVLGGVHLRQDADAELVSAHAGLDARIVAQALEELLRSRWARQVVERQDGLERVGRLVLQFLPVAVAVRSHRFEGSIRRPRSRARRRGEGGELGRRWRKEDYLLCFEGVEWERMRKWGLEDAELRGYDELLVGGRDR